MKLIITIEEECLNDVLVLREKTDYDRATARISCAIVDYDNLAELEGLGETEIQQAIEQTIYPAGDDLTLDQWLATMDIEDHIRAALRRVLDADNEKEALL